MASFNRVILIGNITADPELRYTPKGQAVCEMNIAINEKWTTETGEKKEKVSFFGVTTYGKTAEACGQFMRKGSSALFEGKLISDVWEKDGKKFTKTKVGADRVQFLDRKPEGEVTPLPRQVVKPNVKPAPAAAAIEDDPGSDVPF